MAAAAIAGNFMNWTLYCSMTAAVAFSLVDRATCAAPFQAIASFRGVMMSRARSFKVCFNPCPSGWRAIRTFILHEASSPGVSISEIVGLVFSDTRCNGIPP